MAARVLVGCLAVVLVLGQHGTWRVDCRVSFRFIPRQTARCLDGWLAQRSVAVCVLSGRHVDVSEWLWVLLGVCFLVELSDGHRTVRVGCSLVEILW